MASIKFTGTKAQCGAIFSLLITAGPYAAARTHCRIQTHQLAIHSPARTFSPTTFSLISFILNSNFHYLFDDKSERKSE